MVGGPVDALDALELSAGALAFPGQGSHEDGMRAVVEAWRPDLLATLAEHADGDVFADAHASTAAAQPAIVCASIAYWHALGQPSAAWYTGHSLGELSALVAAGSLDEHDAVRLAARRGQLMQEASDAHPGCGMLAARAPAEQVAAIAEECGVALANHNGPRQIVLSGSAEGLDQAAELLRESRIRSRRLDVAGAFHSPLMQQAVEPFARELERTRFGPSHARVFSPVTLAPMADPRAELAASLTSPVRWLDAVEALAERGVGTFVEVGPGRVLTKLIGGALGEPALARSARELAGIGAGGEDG